MKRLPPIELLQATHRFPGPYVFKVIGGAEPAFASRVVAAVREEMGYERDPSYDTRESSGGRHVAITLELLVRSAEQVHAVYRRLMAVPGVLVML